MDTILRRWRAFRTIHYFLTGNQVISSSSSKLTKDLCSWYFNIEDKADASTNR